MKYSSEILKGKSHWEDLGVDRKIIFKRQFEKFVDWRQCAAVMQREAVTVTLNCIGGGSVVVA
jgi:hypothetical protein